MTPLLLSLILAGGAPAAINPMTMHAVQDDKGVHGVAFRYLAPKGWAVSSRLDWIDNAVSPTELTVGADSPGRAFTFSIVSSLDFPFNAHGPSSYGGQGYQTGVMPPRRLSEFLVAHVKGFNLKSFEVTKRDDKDIPPAALPHARNFGAVGQVEFAFTDDKGRPCTGLVAARCDGDIQKSDGGMGVILVGDWHVENLVVITSPKGEEKKALRFFALSAPTITATRQFAALRYAYVDMLNDKMRAQTAALFRQGQAQLRANQDQYDRGNAVWRQHEAAMDKANRDFCEYVGDVERYRGAGGEEIKASSTPGGAWQNANGTVILSDDPHYDPNGPGSLGWSRLQRAH